MPVRCKYQMMMIDGQVPTMPTRKRGKKSAKDIMSDYQLRRHLP